MNFLESIILDLKRTKKQAEKAIAQLSDEDLHWQPDPESNSIAIIMKHIAGNMISRWTDFLTSDGEKPTRHRDGEFLDHFTSRDELMAVWERGWKCALGAMESLTPADLEKTVYIRSEAHSVPLAIVRQFSHYSSHVGQIVYIAKHRRGEDWQTLSVTRNRSADGAPRYRPE
jgi:Protein of unknown function (DUF1572)